MTKHAQLLEQCAAIGLPAPATELRFHPERKWRFDFAWPAQKVALEVQGGLFVGGRHSRGGALRKEHEKLNAAAALGWRVLFCLPEQVPNGQAVAIVRSVFGA